MNYLSAIDEIVTKLLENGGQKLAGEIQEVIGSSAVSSELLMKVSFKLKEASHEDPKLSNLIDEELCRLLEYCSSIGLIIG